MRSQGAVVILVVMVMVGLAAEKVSASDDTSVQSLQTVVLQQADTIAHLQATVTALTSRLDDITAGASCCNKPSVAFHARLQHSENVTAHHTIVFDEVDLNLGHAYHPTSGTFVAPTPGLYLFHLKVTNGGAGNLHCHIYHNDDTVAEVEAAAETGGRLDRASTLVPLQLRTGDTVMAVRSDGTTTVVFPFLTSSFSGILINGD